MSPPKKKQKMETKRYYPVPFEQFKKLIENLPDICFEVQRDGVAGAGVKTLDECAFWYYEAFFTDPEVRQKYPYKLRPCPMKIKALLLSMPQPEPVAEPLSEHQTADGVVVKVANSGTFTFPVTFFAFKSCVNAKKVLRLLGMTKEERKAVLSDKKQCEVTLKKFYNSFYMFPDRQSTDIFENVSPQFLAQLLKQGEPCDELAKESIETRGKSIVSFKLFEKYLANLYEIVWQLKMEDSRYVALDFDKGAYTFYLDFYLKPEIREKFTFKWQPCSTALQKRLLNIPNEESAQKLRKSLPYQIPDSPNEEELIDIDVDSPMQAGNETVSDADYLRKSLENNNNNNNDSKNNNNNSYEKPPTIPQPELEDNVEVIEIDDVSCAAHNLEKAPEVNTQEKQAEDGGQVPRMEDAPPKEKEPISENATSSEELPKLVLESSEDLEENVFQTDVEVDIGKSGRFLFPVSFDTFRRCINYDEIIRSILMLANQDESQIAALIPHPHNPICEKICIRFYRSFYIFPDSRQRCQYRFSCPDHRVLKKLTEYAVPLNDKAIKTMNEGKTRYQKPTNVVPAEESKNNQAGVAETITALAQESHRERKNIQNIKDKEITETMESMGLKENAKKVPRLPVTFNVFKRYLMNLNEILQQMKLCNEYKDKSDTECTEEYYKGFYTSPQMRKKFEFKLRSCPAKMRDKLLSFAKQPEPEDSSQKFDCVCLDNVVPTATVEATPLEVSKDVSLRESRVKETHENHVSFQLFKRYLSNLDEIVQQMLLCDEHRGKSEMECARDYYKGFYSSQEMRDRFPYQLKPCPAKIRKKLISFPTKDQQMEDVSPEKQSELLDSVSNSSERLKEKILITENILITKANPKMHSSEIPVQTEESLPQNQTSNNSQQTAATFDEKLRKTSSNISKERPTLTLKSGGTFEFPVSFETFKRHINYDEIVKSLLTGYAQNETEKSNHQGEKLFRRLFYSFYVQKEVRKDLPYRFQSTDEELLKQLEEYAVPLDDRARQIISDQEIEKAIKGIRYRFPVSFNTFHKYINYEELKVGLVNGADSKKKSPEQLAEILGDETSCRRLLRSYYYSFYIMKNVRYKLKFNFNAAPPNLCDKLLEWAKPIDEATAPAQTLLQTQPQVEPKQGVSHDPAHAPTEAPVTDEIREKLLMPPPASLHTSDHSIEFRDLKEMDATREAELAKLPRINVVTYRKQPLHDSDNTNKNTPKERSDNIGPNTSPTACIKEDGVNGSPAEVSRQLNPPKSAKATQSTSHKPKGSSDTSEPSTLLVVTKRVEATTGEERTTTTEKETVTRKEKATSGKEPITRDEDTPREETTRSGEETTTSERRTIAREKETTREDTAAEEETTTSEGMTTAREEETASCEGKTAVSKEATTTGKAETTIKKNTETKTINKSPTVPKKVIENISKGNEAQKSLKLASVSEKTSSTTSKENLTVATNRSTKEANKNVSISDSTKKPESSSVPSSSAGSTNKNETQEGATSQNGNIDSKAASNVTQRKTERQIILNQAKKLFFAESSQDHNLAYLICTSQGLKKAIWQILYQLTMEEFKTYTSIHDGEDLYRKTEDLQPFYQHVVDKGNWPINLYVRLPLLRELLHSKGVELGRLDLGQLSPKMLHWREVDECTDFDNIFEMEFKERTGKEMDSVVQWFEEREKFYTACWFHDQWIYQVPQITNDALHDDSNICDLPLPNLNGIVLKTLPIAESGDASSQAEIISISSSSDMMPDSQSCPSTQLSNTSSLDTHSVSAQHDHNYIKESRDGSSQADIFSISSSSDMVPDSQSCPSTQLSNISNFVDVASVDIYSQVPETPLDPLATQAETAASVKQEPIKFLNNMRGTCDTDGCQWEQIGSEEQIVNLDSSQEEGPSLSCFAIQKPTEDISPYQSLDTLLTATMFEDDDEEAQSKESDNIESLPEQPVIAEQPEEPAVQPAAPCPKVPEANVIQSQVVPILKPAETRKKKLPAIIAMPSKRVRLANDKVPQLRHEFRALPLGTCVRIEAEVLRTAETPTEAPRISPMPQPEVDPTTMTPSQEFAKDNTLLASSQLAALLDGVPPNVTVRKVMEKEQVSKNLDKVIVPRPALRQGVIFRKLERFHFFASLTLQHIIKHMIEGYLEGATYQSAMLKIDGRISHVRGPLLNVLFPHLSPLLLSDLERVLRDLPDFEYNCRWWRFQKDFNEDLRKRVLFTFLDAAPEFGQFRLQYNNATREWATCSEIGRSDAAESAKQRPKNIEKVISPHILDKMREFKTQCVEIS